ncbi:MAG: hypothetical protein AAGA48_33900 [Myxococcota bacterium]
MARRHMLVALAVSGALALGLGWWAPRSSVSPPRAARQMQPSRDLRSVAPVAAPPTTPTPPPEPRQAAFVRQIEAITSACDLPLQPLCGSAGCAAVVRSPNLDHLGGWLKILGDRPRLVASTVLRDIGVDPGLLPCGQALDGLGDDPIYSVSDGENGRQWWCTVDSPSALELCNVLVERHKEQAFDGFSNRALRRLHFRAPERGTETDGPP